MHRSRRVGTLMLACGLLATAASVASATDVTDALTFVGIAPCRIFDTRGGSFTGQAGPPALSAGVNRSFQITGTVAGIPAQCGIPSNAAAISVNFTVARFTGPGDIRVFPAGGAVSLTSILNFSAQSIANSTIVPLGTLGANRGITVLADTSSTDILADVNGYYVPRPITLHLSDAPGTTTSTTPVVISSIYSEDMRSQGHLQARLVVRFNGANESPSCTPVGGASGTIQFVNGATVLASVTQICGFRPWLRYSSLFAIPAGQVSLDLRAFTASGTMSWKSVELELAR